MNQTVRVPESQVRLIRRQPDGDRIVALGRRDLSWRRIGDMVKELCHADAGRHIVRVQIEISVDIPQGLAPLTPLGQFVRPSQEERAVAFQLMAVPQVGGRHKDDQDQHRGAGQWPVELPMAPVRGGRVATSSPTRLRRLWF